MAIGENWALENTGAFWLKDAKKVLEQVKKERKQKKYIMVKVCGCPLTYKEVEQDAGNNVKKRRKKSKH